jgi:hypothetical protein
VLFRPEEIHAASPEGLVVGRPTLPPGDPLIEVPDHFGRVDPE